MFAGIGRQNHKAAQKQGLAGWGGHDLNLGMAESKFATMHAVHDPIASSKRYKNETPKFARRDRAPNRELPARLCDTETRATPRTCPVFAGIGRQNHKAAQKQGLAAAIVEEAGKFANEVIAPLNRVGDTHGALFKDGAVTMPPGWKEAYRNWAAAGWNGLSAPVEWGGQGALPYALNAALIEVWSGASRPSGSARC